MHYFKVKKNAHTLKLRVSIQSRQHFAKLCYRFALKARYLDLRHSQHLGRFFLSKAVIIAQIQGLPLLLGKLLNGAAQRYMLDHALLALGVAQNVLKREAVFARLALQAFGRICRRFCKSDVLGCQPGFGRKLRDQRHTAEALLKRAPRVFYMKRTLFDSPADLHCSVITQKPAYLACYLRDNVL